MCGILGSINISFDHSLLDTIAHRGPDDSGMEVFMVNENLVQFAHRRLSIVDLSPAGHQPMISECNNYSIIYNGEIYNHYELRGKLVPEFIFEGNSDTETILYYIREYGINSIKDFNGIFAFAFLDHKKGFLHLVRDRFGVKPLYYYYNENQLIFSSELRPLINILKPEVNLGTIGNCLSIRYFPSPMTPFKDIFKIEPGQILTVGLNQQKLSFTKNNYLAPPKSIGGVNEGVSGLVKTYGDLFEKAVERQLMADVDVGMLLSGGIDSALIAAVAKGKSKRELKSFTIGFTSCDAGIDEIEYARQTSDLLGLKHYIKRCDFTDLLAYIKQTVEIVEEPLGTTSIIPMFFLSQLASSHVKVVLSGQGADEPLGGYIKYKGVPFVGKVRVVRFLSKLFHQFEPLFKRREHVRRIVSSIGADDDIQAYVNYNEIIPYEEICQIYCPSFLALRHNEIIRAKRIFYNRLQKLAPGKANIENLFLYYDLRTSLPDDLLMYTDKITMHFGLECRVPILDNELIEFIESLNSSHKYNFQNGKIIHKAFAKEYLPSSIINRQKLGFKSPTRTWFRIHQEELRFIFRSGNVFGEVFNLEKVNSLIKIHSDGINLEKQIFLLLAVYYFLEDLTPENDLNLTQLFSA